ncbi:hypothetical protein KA005_23590 [bacterium]|nr:hypothetical protein [bacterium]
MRLFRDALKVSFDLFKIMVPVIIVVKILQELDLIRYLAIPLDPVMNVVGLPGEMGLVWATAMLSNIYSSIIVLLSLVKDVPITTAQATILGTMILVAHNLPIELKIAQKSGPHLIFQAISRLGSAFLLGWFLKIVYSWLNLLQQPANILLTSKPENALNNESLASWATGEVQKLFFIFLIILGLFFLLRTLEKLRVVDVINKILRPILKLMGIGPKASAITVIGNTMGIAYGGGLIIHEARSGHIDKKDVFYSLTLMGLSHSLIEDTLLMVMIGGHLSGLLCARVGYSILVVTLLVKVTKHLPTAFCDKFLWGEPK